MRQRFLILYRCMQPATLITSNSWIQPCMRNPSCTYIEFAHYYSPSQ